MKRIFVIDDEPDIVELVSYNLRKSGFEVDYALDGEVALEKLKDEKYDLVVLDLMLPSIDGYQLCSFIRNNPKLSHVPIIMLTARTDEFDKVHGLEMGADDYITKPFSPKELVARVKAIIRRTEPQLLVEDVQDRKSSILKIRDITIDKEKYLVVLGNQDIKLS
ncbi:MAG: response regulator, partial [Thermodesulfovibrionales bacterium]|nr:response regulator [Thermodesulfovibrionales bacterium]